MNSEIKSQFKNEKTYDKNRDEINEIISNLQKQLDILKTYQKAKTLICENEN